MFASLSCPYITYYQRLNLFPIIISFNIFVFQQIIIQGISLYFIQHTIQPHCDLNLRKSHDVEKIVSAAQKHQLRTEQIDRAALKNQLLFLTQPLQYNIHHTMSSPNGSRMRIGQYNIIKSIGVGSFGKVKRKQIHSRLQSAILLLMLTNSTFLQWPFIQLRGRRLL